jgi:choline dehydrogenase-like flavoprotein
VSGTDRTPSTGVDVCIVGSGPAGSLVAHRLARAGHEVVVLEAGKRFDFDERPERMERSIRPGHHPTSVWDTEPDRDAFTVSGEVAYPLNLRRTKGVGGSTLHWGGRVARFPRKDFEMETRYGVASDWPIGYDDLKPYYAEAERAFGVAGTDDNPFEPPRDEPYPMDAFPPSYFDSMFIDACEELDIVTHSVPNARNSEPYDGRSPCVGYGTCIPVCPSGAKYSADVHARKAESEGARLIDRAMVRRLEHDDSGERLTAAVYRTPDGETHRQTAGTFVLAAGAVENARLLLLSSSPQHPDGLANSSDAVGRYFMDHPYIGVYGQLGEPTGQHRIGFGTTESYHFYEPEGQPPPGSFKLQAENDTGPTIPELALKQREPVADMNRLLGRPTGAALAELAENDRPIEWGDDLVETIREEYGNHFQVLAEIEPLPDPENRVTLSEDRTDQFGDPVPDISWDRGEYSRRTAERAFEVIEEIIEQFDAEVKWTERGQTWKGAGHSSGTTRMGTDPDESVVDPNLRTHDVENLYVAGASTFVTIGASQPTLTIAATSLRLADHLDREVL